MVGGLVDDRSRRMAAVIGVKEVVDAEGASEEKNEATIVEEQGEEI